MRFKNIDHIVITTQDVDACLHFYVDILGMELDQRNGRYAVRFAVRSSTSTRERPSSFRPQSIRLVAASTFA